MSSLQQIIALYLTNQRVFDAVMGARFLLQTKTRLGNKTLNTPVPLPGGASNENHLSLMIDVFLDGTAVKLQTECIFQLPSSSPRRIRVEEVIEGDVDHTWPSVGTRNIRVIDYEGPPQTWHFLSTWHRKAHCNLAPFACQLDTLQAQRDVSEMPGDLPVSKKHKTENKSMAKKYSSGSVMIVQNGSFAVYPDIMERINLLSTTSTIPFYKLYGAFMPGRKGPVLFGRIADGGKKIHRTFSSEYVQMSDDLVFASPVLMQSRNVPPPLEGEDIPAPPSVRRREVDDSYPKDPVPLEVLYTGSKTIVGVRRYLDDGTEILLLHDYTTDPISPLERIVSMAGRNVVDLFHKLPGKTKAIKIVGSDDLSRADPSASGAIGYDMLRQDDLVRERLEYNRKHGIGAWKMSAPDRSQANSRTRKYPSVVLLSE